MNNYPDWFDVLCELPLGLDYLLGTALEAYNDYQHYYAIVTSSVTPFALLHEYRAKLHVAEKEFQYIHSVLDIGGDYKSFLTADYTE